ncbi:alpha-galactosidase [Bifidobacterium simiarum]|uniref:alpha-galactosidase n=1 Tax=Bifidobacterium simiarum TaxID=2045441 RepID=UPI001BDCC7AA|nr:alpha-galactosidase [Bifidobacterium simiarum]MBT1165957.1 alpha-galactosidase [Bifidobacterium simiarum]
MIIIDNLGRRQFHLSNGRISHIMRVLENGDLNTLYFGSALRCSGDMADLQDIACRDVMQAAERYGGLSKELVRREYPQTGSSDLRPCALSVRDATGSHAVNLTYRSHRVIQGKPELEGLPSSYVTHPEDGKTLLIDMADPRFGLSVTLSYTLFDDLPAIVRSARIINVGHRPLTVEAAYSANLDLPDADWDLITLTGAWGRECSIQRMPLRIGSQGVSSLRGHSSQHASPYLALARRSADEMQGEAIGAALLYSGNFDADVHADSYGTARLRIGINPALFAWHLEPGESFVTPEAVIAHAEHGLNDLSQTFYVFARDHVMRGPWKDRRRPIVLNTWEAVHMAMDLGSLTDMARSAADLGVEMLVVDDGWFGHRDRADSSLGDWTPDPRKFPDGLRPLADAVHGLGLKLGLWFEPEMISEDSELYRAHPDWVLADPRIPLRDLNVQRRQFVLDMTRPEVVDYLYSAMTAVIGGAGIDYVKWDMNRSLAEVYSTAWPPERQGEIYHRYVLGYYDLLRRLTTRFPDLLIESCASGGARVDFGTLAYAPQAWISDDTDAVERVRIQYGTSMVQPPDAMSNHVSAVPNEQTGRTTSFGTRAAVAMFGTFGYELDPRRLTDAEREAVRRQIGFVRSLDDLMVRGTFWRLISPFDARSGFGDAGFGGGSGTDLADAAWMVVSPDRRTALVGWYRALTGVNLPVRHLRLAGLDDALRYAVTEIDLDGPVMRTAHRPRYGDELRLAGLTLTDRTTVTWGSPPLGDGTSRLFLLKAAS